MVFLLLFGKTNVKKTIVAGSFAILGVALGFGTVWFNENTDAVFLLNIPGTLLGDAAYSLSIRFFGDPISSQAHYTVPWLFRIPQIYVPASVLFWGIIGSLFAVFLKRKAIAFIMGLYFLVFGIIYLLTEIRA